MAEGTTKHVIPAGGNLFKVRLGSEGFTIDETLCSCHKVPGMNFWPDQSMYSIVVPPKPRKMPGRPKKKRIKAIVKQTPKPKGVPGRLRKNQSADDSDDVDVVLRGQVRDEGASESRGGATGSRGRGGAAMSKGGASGSRGKGDGGSGSASGSRGRGAGGSSGASGSRGRKPVSTVGTQKRQGKKKTQHEPVVTQDEDQVEQTEDQAEIELTQLEQTQEQTQDQVQPQEQPQQAALRMPSARILQRKLGKQGSSQNIALNVE
ncbi:hypothetical protein Tco_0905340 [Tanacetum coccineum]